MGQNGFLSSIKATLPFTCFVQFFLNTEKKSKKCESLISNPFVIFMWKTGHRQKERAIRGDGYLLSPLLLHYVVGFILLRLTESLWLLFPVDKDIYILRVWVTWLRHLRTFKFFWASVQQIFQKQEIESRPTQNQRRGQGGVAQPLSNFPSCSQVFHLLSLSLCLWLRALFGTHSIL